MILANYQPQAVLSHFEAISQIPRGSGNEKAVSDYIANFAKGLGHPVVQDAVHNLVIFKAAAPGQENSPPIMLQAHLDMVCEKNAGVDHDFLTDPIKLYVDGDFIKAEGTTLGADNGMGVAICMALLADTTLKHPALEIVLTVEEETGMSGAGALDTSQLKAKRMINLDNSNSKGNEIIMGCAAGTTVDYTIDALWEKATGTGYRLTVKGLTGGHSGDDIEKERGNAIRILGQVLQAAHQSAPIAIGEIKGGMKVNAIPREAMATFTATAPVEAVVETMTAQLKTQYRKADPNLEIILETATVAETCNATDSLLASINLMPNGALAFSTEISGLVNASCNLGVIETAKGGFLLNIMPRGMDRFYNQHTEQKITTLAKATGSEVKFIERSPAWPYNPNSALLNAALPYYAPIFGEAPIIGAIHAGLECGLFAEKIPGLDIISIGPTNIDLHTPDERISLKSTAQYWEFICKLLGAL